MRKDEARAVTVKVLKEAFADFGRTFGREMRDFMRQELLASETRIKKELRIDMSNLKTKILDGIGDIVDNGIHPQLDDHERRISKLETRIN